MSANQPATWFGPGDIEAMAEEYSLEYSGHVPSFAYFDVMKKNVEAMGRKHFEERVFNRYFVAHITVDPSAQFALQSGCDKTLAELCAKDAEGDYIDPDIQKMWFGYNVAYKALMGATEIYEKVLQAASK